MGLSDAVARYAVRAAHVLVVEAPGHWVTRAAVERHLLARGWRIALSPAEADVLAVCGTPGPDLAENVERLWEQMPGPRARVEVTSPGDAIEALSRAQQTLLDVAGQRDDARTRSLAPHEDAHEHGGHGEHQDHGEHENHGGHGDHGGMDMAPAGIPLAGGGEDRDGLEMDVLHVRLGPVLSYWPAGLVLRCALQGDVVVEAETSLVDGVADAPDQPAVPHHAEARRCDNAASLLALAGWDEAASRARQVRDLLLDEQADAAEATRLLDDLQRRVRRSWPLRWALRGLAPLDDDTLGQHGLPARLRGDTHDRLMNLFDRARGAGTDGSVPLEAIAPLVTGLDLATARLVVASLDLDPVLAPEVTRA